MHPADFFAMILDQAKIMLRSNLDSKITSEKHREILDWSKTYYTATAQLFGIDISEFTADNFAIAVGLVIASRLE